MLTLNVTSSSNKVGNVDFSNWSKFEDVHYCCKKFLGSLQIVDLNYNVFGHRFNNETMSMKE